MSLGGRSGFVVFAASIGLGTLAPLSTAPARDRPVEKSILVTVLDGQGMPVTGLAATDFTVFEDRERREVSSVAPAADPMFVVVLIDTTRPLPGIDPPTLNLRSGLAAFVRIVQASNPASEVSLMETAGAAVATVKFTSRPDELEKAIGRLYPSQRSSAVLLEALVDASAAVTKKPGPRRVIVSINFSSPEASTLEPARVGDAVRKSGASVWAVSIESPQSVSSFQTGTHAMDNILSPTREVLLTNLPPATGGIRLTAVSAAALEQLLTQVARCLTSQYVVRYMRPDGAPPSSIQATSRRGAKVLIAPWVQ